MDSDGLLQDGGCKFDHLTDRDDRINFVKKVYSILGAQLLFTAIMTIIPMTTPGAAHWMADNYGLLIAAIVIAIVVECTLICVRSVSRKVPINYILLFIFTLCEAYLVGFICAA